MKFKDLPNGAKFRFIGSTIYCTKDDEKKYNGVYTIRDPDKEVEVPQGVEFIELRRGQRFYWVYGTKCHVKLNEDMYRTPDGREKYVHSSKRLTLAYW